MGSEDSSQKRTRASGEVLEYLLQQFEVNHNPSPEQRKVISDKTNMSEKAVRIWFQNRRAKLRKSERKYRLTHGGSMDSSRSSSTVAVDRHSTATLDRRSHQLAHQRFHITDKYCFVDCTSLSVGSWQRVRSGTLQKPLLEHDLVNLSPFTLNKVMQDYDLLVIISKKNLEVNYFFAAMTEQSRILFRIFYPIASILSCSLLDNNVDEDCSELRVTLAHQPKFSVNFFNGVSNSSNQWSICGDFSEGQQVSAANRDSGSYMPHVLVGTKDSILFLNDFILEKNQQHLLDYMVDVYVPEQEPEVSKPVDTYGIDDNLEEDFQFSSTVGPVWNETNELKANGLLPLGQFAVGSPRRRSDLRYSANEMFAANTPDFVNANTPQMDHTSQMVQTPMDSTPRNEDPSHSHSSRMHQSPYQNVQQENFTIPTDEAFDFPVVNDYSGLDHSNIHSPTEHNIDRFIDYSYQ